MEINKFKKVLLSSDDNIGNIYIFPGLGGHVLEFRDIAKTLAPDWNVVGIIYPAYTGDDRVYKSITELANYICQKTDFKIGNTVFIGHSFGGLIAYEISRILKLKGQKVPIILLDTIIHYQRNNQPFIIKLNRKLQKQLSKKYSLKKVLTKVFNLKSLSTKTKQKNKKILSKKNQTIKNFQSNVFEIYNSYAPPYVSISIYLIKSDAEFFYNLLSDDYGWSQAGNVVYVSSSVGTHRTIVKKQNIEFLTKKLKIILSKIIISHGTLN